MNTGKAILAVMAGIAAGAVLGALFAPQRGSYAGKNITKKGEDLANALNEKIDEKFDELTGAMADKIKKSKPQNDFQTRKTEMMN